MISRLIRIIKGLWYLAFPSARERVLARYEEELRQWDILAAGGTIQQIKAKPTCVPRYRWVQVDRICPEWRLLDCQDDKYIGESITNFAGVFHCYPGNYRTLERAQQAALADLRIEL